MNADPISQTELVEPRVHEWHLEARTGPVQGMNTNLFAPFLDRVVGPVGAAEVLEISLRTLDNVRDNDPTFPAPRYIGRLPRWTVSTLLAWVAAPASHQLLLAGDVEDTDLDAELADLADEESWNVH
jgi:predicted DNA-binding transcriptional regulator AlpA